jgi:hypothetical protein
MEVKLHAFLKFALDEGEWSTSGSDCFISNEISTGMHWIECCMVPGTGKEVVKIQKIPVPAANLTPISQPIGSYFT